MTADATADSTAAARADMAERVERAAALLGPRAAQDVTLSAFTTFRIGGPARLLVRAQTIDDFRAIHAAVRATDIDVLVVGQGSNLLIGDAGWPGLVVVIESGGDAESLAIDASGDGFVIRAGSGMKLPVLARRSVAEGATGLEWMVGVPGSVGGAVRMNAGGHGSDVAANMVSARVLNLDSDIGVTDRPAVAFGFGYRHSDLSDREVVIEATFHCSRGAVAAGEEILREIVRWRRANQPGGANCGSVFTNPPADSAGRLIDAAGLKGRRIGGASVSDKHANFIQADPGATAVDVWSLIVLVRGVVFERFGIVLTPEVRTAGFVATLPPLGPSSTGAAGVTTESTL